MDIGSVSGTTAAAMMAQQVQATTQLQMSILKQLAESDQQMAEMLQTLGMGQNIDLEA